MRPWKLWILFVLCLSVLLAAMGWVSHTLLRLEREKRDAEELAAVEEVVRLALWRMDAAVAPLIIQESARPYFEYAAFNPASLVNPNSIGTEEAQKLIPSPLLLEPSSNVLVYFNGMVDPQGNLQISSPQVPDGELLELARRNYKIEEQLGDNNDRLNDFLGNVGAGDLQALLGAVTSAPAPPTQVAWMNDFDQRAFLPQPAQQPQVAQQETLNAPIQQRGDQQPVTVQAGNQQGDAQNGVQQVANQTSVQQEWLNVSEYNVRFQQAEQVKGQLLETKRRQYYEPKRVKGKGDKGSWKASSGKLPEMVRAKPAPRVVQSQLTYEALMDGDPVDMEIRESVMRPFWVKGFLVLARTVQVGSHGTVQGAWLDWDALKRELLGKVRDVLPDADLVPVESSAGVSASRMMAALPARLVPGRPANLLPPAASPMRLPLILAWSCVLLAAGSVALLLVGTVSLSERRGAFVSAVTHELRTPLTTFRMYSEMLAENMVADEAKRKYYLETLCAEGNRLSHLVENVLAFARLERGRAGSQVETVSVDDLVERIRGRLAQRAEQAGMELVVKRADAAAPIRADLSAVEQILFNLVDNACKYAAQADDKRIHIKARCSGRFAVIRVCDHGPGIAAADARVLFKPFRKSAKHAAESAPGVGLGLALSRRLARQLGGRIRIDPAVTDGACFELSLPLSGA